MTDIFAVSPEVHWEITCPQCKSASLKKELLFQGIHVLAICKCTNCNCDFYVTLPVGHDLLFPCSFEFSGKLLSETNEAKTWLIDPLIQSLIQNKKQVVVIEKELRDQKENAIILNCLDNCFGHVFYKLWNLQLLKAKYPDHSIIIFIPKRMRWLLPDGFSEVWLFDASFKSLENWQVNLDDEVRQNLLPRFKTVSLSKAYTHLSMNNIDLKKILKTETFNLARFSAYTPQITFVLREDRFWHRYPLEYFLFKVFAKLNLPKHIFIWRQNQLFNRVARLLKGYIPHAKFSAVGLGKTGRFKRFIIDERKKDPSVEDEKNWMDLYSRTHVVVGIHGSNMLIPTALAAGFMEILPREKIRHVAEDTLLNTNSRYTLFLGRHVDHFSSPDMVAHHLIRMITDFPYLYKNTEQEI